MYDENVIVTDVRPENRKDDSSQVDKLLDFLSTFQDKFSSGILRLHQNGSGSFYNASCTGINVRKEVKFKNTKELKRLINEI